MSTQQSPQGSTAPAASTASSSSAARTRSLILLGILVLLLIALWYDYKVARPGVERAYEDITALNDSINKQAGRKYMTNQDVQTALKRAPAAEYDQNGYHVEIYHFRSGLPIKAHKYFAVYTDGSPTIFLKHYKFEMDPAELTSVPLNSAIPDAPKEGAAPAPNMSASPGGPGGTGRRARPASSDEPSGDLAKPLEGSPEATKSETKSDAAETEAKKEPAASETPAAKEDKPAEEKKPAEKAKEEAKEEKPKEDAPKADAAKEDKPSADKTSDEKPKEEKP